MLLPTTTTSGNAAAEQLNERKYGEKAGVNF